jgi:hypothetical protein
MTELRKAVGKNAVVVIDSDASKLDLKMVLAIRELVFGTCEQLK